VIGSKAQLSYWEKDFPKALELYNKALKVTSQSFITLLKFHCSENSTGI
jgi:hypothetical protein